MANMSYCRFENTVGDMKDCYEDLVEAVESGLSMEQFMERLGTDYERSAVRRMAQLVLDMAEAFEALNDNEGLTEEQLEELDDGA